MAHLDGSNLHKIPDTSADNVPIGWLPDGRRILMATILGQWGSQMHSVDINTGESRNYFMIEIHKGGTYSASSYASRVAFVELPFGKQSYGVYTSNLNGTGKKLVAGLTNEALVGGWSPDGKWVNITTARFQRRGAKIHILPGPAGYLPGVCRAGLGRGGYWMGKIRYEGYFYSSSLISSNDSAITSRSFSLPGRFFPNPFNDSNNFAVTSRVIRLSDSAETFSPFSNHCAAA